MPDHADQTCFLLLCVYRFCIGEIVRQRNFDLHMFPGVHAPDRLCRVHLRRRTQDGCFDPWLRQGLVELGAGMPDPVLFGDLPGRLEAPPDERNWLQYGTDLNVMVILGPA